MRATDLIDALYGIINESNTNPEIDETFIRAILGLPAIPIINIRNGRPVLKVVGDDNVD